MSELPTSDVLSTLKAKLSAANPRHTILLQNSYALALIECAERLKLVIAADDKAIDELAEMGLFPTDSDYFSLVAGNKAAIVKLESLP